MASGCSDKTVADEVLGIREAITPSVHAAAQDGRDEHTSAAACTANIAPVS